MKVQLILPLLRTVFLAALLSPAPTFACATCFGASDSDMARGMTMGIFSLLAVVVVVLTTFAAFFVFLARRANTHPLTPVTSQATANTHVP